jgi:hypothetical protein
MFKINFINFRGNEKEILLVVNNAYNYVSNFFSVDYKKKIIIRVHGSRKSFEKELNEKTADWCVANTNKDGEIDILSPVSMSKESSHAGKEFLSILRHELTHVFINFFVKNSAIPMWLSEGLANYVADQNRKIDSALYLGSTFCERLGTKRGWDENVNYDAYNISARFVSFLINKFGTSKIIKLIKNLDTNYYYSNFEIIFKKIYKKELKGLEKEFAKNPNR